MKVASSGFVNGIYSFVDRIVCGVLIVIIFNSSKFSEEAY